MATGSDIGEWLNDRKNCRAIPHRLESCGYTPVRNDAAKEDGYWVVADKRVAIYAKKELSLSERLAAAKALAEVLRTKRVVELVKEQERAETRERQKTDWRRG